MIELKKDYAAFLRQNRLPTWALQDPIRQELIDKRFKAVDEVARWGADVHRRTPERSYAEIAGNIGLVYCMVAIGLLDRQLVRQARDFEKNGGFSERLYKTRKQSRDSEPPKPEPPQEPAA